jgi:hypothetical protein
LEDDRECTIQPWVKKGAYSFVVDGVVVVMVGGAASILNESFLVGTVVLKTSAEELGFGGLEITELKVRYAT